MIMNMILTSRKVREAVRHIMQDSIGSIGKFVHVLKKTWNAEDLNLSIYWSNYVGAILLCNLSPFFRQTENSVLPEDFLNPFSFISTNELQFFPLWDFLKIKIGRNQRM